MGLKAAAKSLAHRSGFLDTLHRSRNGACLTVLMFHRVQPRQEQESCQADPLYTVTPDLLSAIVDFARRNYSLVSAPDVLASLRRRTPLPSRPLLITFDDGWYDNLAWALPVLAGNPWLLFVATDAASKGRRWWQEILLWVLRSGRTSCEDLLDAAQPVPTLESRKQNDSPVLAVLNAYGALDETRRNELLAHYARELAVFSDAPHMLNAADLTQMRARGVDLGSHGASHLPLSSMADPLEDLRLAKAWLAPFDPQPVVSFPHGRYGEAALAAARSLGYEAIFTSDPVLNPCPGGWLKSDLIGRIPLGSASVGDARGGLAPERLATRLYLRETRALSQNMSLAAG